MNVIITRGAGTAVGQGRSKKVEDNRNLWKTKKSLPICLLLNNNVDLKNNKRNCRKFVSIRSWCSLPWNYLWCCYKTNTSAPLPRSPAFLLTAISSCCLAALPAKTSAFNSQMRQNAYYRNLKRRLEDLLPCYSHAIKTNRRTIRSQVG